MSQANPQKNYIAILEKIHDLGTKQQQIYPQEIHCQKGCSSCCKPPDSLFLVEVEPLKKAIQSLPNSIKQQIQTQLEQYQNDQRIDCPLLIDGACTAYQGRPVICRTHGYALWSRETNAMSWCHLNFTDLSPEQKHAFDLDRLNQMLSLITQLSWPNHPTGREKLTSLIAEALQSSEDASP